RFERRLGLTSVTTPTCSAARSIRSASIASARVTSNARPAQRSVRRHWRVSGTWRRSARICSTSASAGFNAETSTSGSVPGLAPLGDCICSHDQGPTRDGQLKNHVECRAPEIRIVPGRGPTRGCEMGRNTPTSVARPPAGFHLALASIAVVCLALYARQLFGGNTFVLRDHIIYTWPERQILADALRAGRIPEWNDLVGFGTQFA